MLRPDSAVLHATVGKVLVQSLSDLSYTLNMVPCFFSGVDKTAKRTISETIFAFKLLHI